MTFITVFSDEDCAQAVCARKSSQRTEARELRPEETEERAPETRAARNRPVSPCSSVSRCTTK